MTERRILVVEDDAGTSLLVGEILRSEGIVIEYAADGVDALETLRTSVPDLVVLDLVLPDMAGGEVLEGCYVRPCLVRAPAELPKMREETFAPILYVFSYKNIEDALALHHSAIDRGEREAIEAAVKAGTASVMSSFNELNGVPASGNRMLLTDILRDAWGFDGFVVSDWFGVHDPVGAARAMPSQGCIARTVPRVSSCSGASRVRLNRSPSSQLPLVDSRSSIHTSPPISSTPAPMTGFSTQKGSMIERPSVAIETTHR